MKQIRSYLMSVAFLGVALAQAGEFDGHWYVTKMECNGERASPGTKNLYTPPNYISVDIQGNQGAFVDLINGCHKVIPLAFQYPSQDLMTASFSGPIQCSPVNCDTGCGMLLPLTVAYRVERRTNTLVWNSIGPVDDNCAKGGQTDPITYYMHQHQAPR